MDRRLLIVVAGALLVFGANIGGTSVYILDEAKNSSCAMEMYQRGDWVVPTFNNELRTDKPPLHYFFMRGAYNVLGVTPFAARAFSVLMGVLLVAGLYLIVGRVANKEVAFWSSLLLVVSIQLAIQFHLAVPDPYLISLLTLGLLAFYYAYVKDKKYYFLLSYGAICLATLAKGPVALAFAGLTALIFLLTQEKFSIKMLMRIRLGWAIVLFGVLVLPWYILVGIETNGEWLRGFFLEHNLGRFTSTMEGHKSLPLASLVIALVALLPFSFFSPQAVRLAWNNRKTDSLTVFSSIAALVVIVFFAFSRTLLPSYPEPAVPFVAILLGIYFNEVLSGKQRASGWKISAVIYFIVSLALPVAAWIALSQDTTLYVISGQSYFFSMLPVGAVIAMVFVFRGKNRSALLTYAIASFLFLLTFFYWVFPKVDQLNPVVKSIARMDRSVPVYYHQDFNPAFVFALGKPIDIWSPNTLSEPVYVLTQKRYAEDFASYNTTEVYMGQDLFERQQTLVLRIDP